jgi:hypothetical protein
VLCRPNLIYLEDTRFSLCLDNREVRMFHPVDQFTGAAFPTYESWRLWLGTINCLGKAQRKCSASNAAWSSEEISMTQSSVSQMILQQFHCPVMTEYAPVVMIESHGLIVVWMMD